jgi:hypothetical protein
VSELPPLRLFPDRSTNGKRFIGGVRRLVEDVETIGDRYGIQDAEGVTDVRWIADATSEGRILVGADRRILRNPSNGGRSATPVRATSSSARTI